MGAEDIEAEEAEDREITRLLRKEGRARQTAKAPMLVASGPKPPLRLGPVEAWWLRAVFD